MESSEKGAFLDSRAARGVAFLCFLLCVAALVYLNRDALVSAPETAAVGDGDDPFARCVAESVRKIDKMRADGVIQAGQATLFRSRAEARCRAQAGQGGRPSGQPGQPPLRPR